MSQVDRAAVEQAIAQYQDPYLKTDLISMGCLRQLDIEGSVVSAELVLGYAAGSIVGGIAHMIQTAVENLEEVSEAHIKAVSYTHLTLPTIYSV